MSDEAFYPSLVVNLNIRFEEKLQVHERGTDGQFRNEFLVQNQGVGTFVLNRVPRKCTVRFQGHTQAATFSLIFDYKELPIDPRTIIASTVEIHVGTVSASDFADGMVREFRPGLRKSILNTRNADGTPRTDTLLFYGPVDKWSMKHEEGGSEIHLEGRDLRGLLLDSPLVSVNDKFDLTHQRFIRRPKKKRSTILDRLNTEKNIVDLVNMLLREHDTLTHTVSGGLRAVGFPEEWPGGVFPSPGRASHVPRHRRGAHGQGGGSGSAHNNMNFWDVITRYSYLVGGVPTIVGREVQIRYAPALYAQVTGRSPSRIPFAGNRPRQNPDGTERFIRGIVYGRDVNSMEIERVYAGNHKPKTVRCISNNPSSGRRGRDQLLEASWPPRNVREARREGVQGNNTTLRDFIGGQESQETLNIPVRGITDIAQLTEIAKAYYEQIGRNELKGHVSMDKVTSFGGSNADPDLLRLRVGDPVELLVDVARIDNSSPIATALSRSAGLPFDHAVNELNRILPDRNLCRAIAGSARGGILDVLRYFRVSGIDLDWSDESISLKFDIQNYWTPRWDETARDRHRRAQQRHPVDRARVATVSRDESRRVFESIEEHPARSRRSNFDVEERSPNRSFDIVERSEDSAFDIGERTSNSAEEASSGVRRWR